MVTGKEYFHGLLASAFLLGFYFAVVSWLQGISYAWSQFASQWYLMLPLVAGFGVQVGLFSRIRAAAREGVGMTAACGGVSSGSMVACCAHHLADVVPLLGIAGLSAFITAYQQPFLVLGVASNAVGITFMLGMVKTHKLYDEKGVFAWLFLKDLEEGKKAVVVLGVVGVVAAFAFTALSQQSLAESKPSSAQASDFKAASNSGGGLDVEVTPLALAPGMESVFEVSFNTHQGSLDFEVAQVAFLEDDKGNDYKALKWEGDAPTGHHRSGKLYFEAVKEGAGKVALRIEGVYGVPERVFEWGLK